MTEDEIIRMAWKTGLVIDGNNSGDDDLFAFANLVAEREREACAEVVDAAKAGEEDWDSNDWNQAVEFCASRIRARGTP